MLQGPVNVVVLAERLGEEQQEPIEEILVDPGPKGSKGDTKREDLLPRHERELHVGLRAPWLRNTLDGHLMVDEDRLVVDPRGDEDLTPRRARCDGSVDGGVVLGDLRQARTEPLARGAKIKPVSHAKTLTIFFLSAPDGAILAKHAAAARCHCLAAARPRTRQRELPTLLLTLIHVSVQCSMLCS